MMNSKLLLTESYNHRHNGEIPPMGSILDLFIAGAVILVWNWLHRKNKL
jgi:hypothetical protein